MKDLYEITMKKVHPNPENIYRISIGFEGLTRDQAMIKAVEFMEKLGLEADISYIIRGYREEV